VCSLLVWLPFLPLTQAEQRLRTQVELDMKAGRIAEALDLMSEYEQSHFPPGWDPPPRIGYPQETGRILDVMAVIQERGVAPWVRAVYVDKLRRYTGAINAYSDRPLRGADLVRTVRALQQLPEGPDIAAEHASSVESQIRDLAGPIPSDDERFGSFGRTAEELEALKAFVTLAKKSTRPKQ
jgi:hypothetical protein